MNFYSLVEKESGDLLADIVEFENKEIAIYWFCYDENIGSLFTYSSINIVKEYFVNSDRILIKEGVEEDFNDVKDLLYSA